MTRLPKTIYRCNTICIKLSMILFTELEQINLKFIWNHKGTKIIKAILQKKKTKNKLGCITFSRLQTTLQSYSNQASMIPVQKQTYGSMERNSKPRNKPPHLQSINLRQRRQGYTWRKDNIFSKWCWENWGASYKSMKILPHTL